MTIVIDSSTAASWSIPDEQSLAAAKALAASRSDYVVVPSLFWHEFRNVLLVAQRRNRLTAGELEAAIMAVSALSPLVDDLDDNFAVLSLAQRHNLTAYDAAYLELALREKAILATLDRRLAEAGRIERLTVLSDH